MKDQDLDKLLAARAKPPRADDVFLARLKAVSVDHAQVPIRAATGETSLFSQFGDLLRALSPGQILTQSGAMAAALVVGLWLGMGSQSAAVAEEIDIVHWLADGDLDIYEEEADDE